MFGFSEREIRGLLQHTEFPQIPDEFHQLCFVDDHAKKSLTHPLGAKELTTLFELNGRAVHKNRLRGRSNQSLSGRRRH
jgi:hypothetical protein